MTGNLMKGNSSANSSGPFERASLRCAHSIMPSNNLNSEQACNRMDLHQIS